MEAMAARGTTVILCGVREGILKVLRNVRLEERLGPQRVFPEGPAVWSSTLQAVERAYEILGQDRCDTCPLRREEPAAARNWNYTI
jgi:hypothetical protein